MGGRCSQKPRGTQVQFLSRCSTLLQPGQKAENDDTGNKNDEENDDDDDVNHLHAIDISRGEEGDSGNSDAPAQENKNLQEHRHD